MCVVLNTTVFLLESIGTQDRTTEDQINMDSAAVSSCLPLLTQDQIRNWKDWIESK